MLYHTPLHQALQEQQKHLFTEWKKQVESWSHSGPCKCPVCDSRELKEVVKDSIEHIVSEFEVRCARCNESIAYWAYGSYQEPGYYMLDEGLSLDPHSI